MYCTAGFNEMLTKNLADLAIKEKEGIQRYPFQIL